MNVKPKFYLITNLGSRDQTLVQFWTQMYPKLVLLTVYFGIFFAKGVFDVKTYAYKLKSAFYKSIYKVF